MGENQLGAAQGRAGGRAVQPRDGNARRGGKPGTVAGSAFAMGAGSGSAAEKSNPALMRSIAPGGSGGGATGVRLAGAGNRPTTAVGLAGARTSGRAGNSRNPSCCPGGPDG